MTKKDSAATPSELYQAGKLAEAIEAAVGVVKRRPADVPARYLLAELLCFSGDLERADKQLETVFQQSTEAAVRISLFRQLIRAETTRQEFFAQGHLPEFIAEASPELRLHLDASIAIREGKDEEAAALLAKSEEQRVHVSGSCDGHAFDDLRDMDDLTSSFFEVLTGTGKYYWVPMDKVELIEFHAPERPLDLLWRKAHLVVSGGPDGEVYLPAVYSGTLGSGDDQLRLGRGTDWVGGDNSPVRGRGQRMYLVADEAKPMLQMGRLEFNSA